MSSVIARSATLIPSATFWPRTSISGSIPTGTAIGLIFSVGSFTLKPRSMIPRTIFRTSTRSRTKPQAPSLSSMIFCTAAHDSFDGSIFRFTFTTGNLGAARISWAPAERVIAPETG